MKSRRAVALTLALVGLVVTVAACGTSTESSGSEQAKTPTTYTNDKYGFSLTHDGTFTELEGESSAGAGSSPVFSIAFADAGGAEVDDLYVDGLMVSVYKLDAKVKAAQVPKLKKAFKSMTDSMIASLDDAKVTEKLSPMELNGVPGFNMGYTYMHGDTPIKAVAFYLVKGNLEYAVTGQATTENWAALSPSLEAAIMSFATN